MALPRNLFAASFRRQRMSALFTAVVGFMVFAATLAVAAEATLSAVTITWDKHLSSLITVEIPAVEDETSMPQEQRVGQALAILHAMPDVAKAEQVPDSDTLQLLQPWIGDTELLKTLPVPTLIEVTKKSGAALSGEEIAAHLKSVIADVRVDDHAAWLEDLARLIRGLVMMGAVMMLLAAATVGITVGFFCRAVMAAEQETVALLHVMGAEDNDIAKHFETLARQMSMTPALIGFGVAAVMTALLAFCLQHFSILGPLDVQGSFLLGLGVVLVPGLAIAITAYTARFSVLELLRAMP